MPGREADLLHAIETHAPRRIEELLASGLDPRAPVRGKDPVRWLTEMYTRSDRFAACLRVLLAAGGALDDPVLAPVLLDDAEALQTAIAADPSLIGHRATMVSSFTPLTGASLLHVAAEYGNLAAARVLLDHGADLEAQAGLDENRLGGQTPLFHTVNSNQNRSAPILRLFLERGARADARVEGLTWGKGFEWETTFFDLTPIAYAQLGLLPQMHRNEEDIHDNVRLLLEAARRRVPPRANVPNRYLARPGAA
jgi:ankyrin repeat protein